MRFLDNFSAGTRGAASAEYFLAAGYAVIFLSRQHSQFPYTRRYSHTTNPFFDILQEPDEAADTEDVRVQKTQVQTLLPVLHAYHQARQSGRLLTVPFVTVVEYLFLLRGISEAMAPLGPRAMHYLAAAVSDFFIPSDRISEHKIQSNDGALHLTMDPVPKVLANLVRDWVPQGFVVSFKLETDDKLIVSKSEASLERYGHQLVIGNDLARRKTEVVLIEHTARISNTQGTPRFTHTYLRLTKEAAGVEIEEEIVAALRDRHTQWIDTTSSCGT